MILLSSVMIIEIFSEVHSFAQLYKYALYNIFRAMNSYRLYTMISWIYLYVHFFARRCWRGGAPRWGCEGRRARQQQQRQSCQHQRQQKRGPAQRPQPPRSSHPHPGRRTAGYATQASLLISPATACISALTIVLCLFWSSEMEKCKLIMYCHAAAYVLDKVG